MHGRACGAVLCLSFPGARTGTPAGAGALVALCSWKGSSTRVVLVQEVWPPRTRKRLARVLCLWLAGSRTQEVLGRGTQALPAPWGLPCWCHVCRTPGPRWGGGAPHTCQQGSLARAPGRDLWLHSVTVTCQAAKALARDQQAAMQGDRIEPAEAGLSQWFLVRTLLVLDSSSVVTV